jgi:type II secretory pathway pseudopilin PulG
MSGRLSKRTAFTIVELMTVIAIMGLLVGMIVTASMVVVKNQRAQATKNVLLKLDQVLEEYVAQRNTVPAFVATLYVNVPDAPLPLSSYRGESYPDRPDASVFLRSVKGVGECDLLVASLPESFLVKTDGEGDDEFGPMVSVGDSWSDWPEEPLGLVYYVHPDNYLAQAIYGRCINKRPYFVSAGADGMWGHPQELAGLDPYPGSGTEEQEFMTEWRSDNVYSYDGIPTDFDVPNDAGNAVLNN